MCLLRRIYTSHFFSYPLDGATEQLLPLSLRLGWSTRDGRAPVTAVTDRWLLQGSAALICFFPLLTTLATHLDTWTRTSLFLSLLPSSGDFPMVLPT